MLATVLACARSADALHLPPDSLASFELELELVSSVAALAARLRATRLARPSAIVIEMHPEAPSPP